MWKTMAWVQLVSKSVSEKVRSCIMADALGVISPAFQRGANDSVAFSDTL